MSIKSFSAHIDRPITLLVVESDAQLGDRISAFCAELDDLTVSQVDTATEALIYLDAESEVDLLISEQNLSDRSGLDLLEQVRTRHPELPFILVGTNLSGAEARTAFVAGATDVVRLDTTADGLDVLLARVERAIGVARRRRQRHTDRSSDLTSLFSDLQLLVEELAGARSPGYVADCVAAAAVTAAGMTHAEVHLFDPTEHRLRRVATETPLAGTEREPTVGLDPLLWETYLTGEPHALTLPARDHLDEDPDETTGGDTVLVPLGRFGVLRVSRGEPGGLDYGGRQLVELLGAVATVSLDSVEQSLSRRQLEQKFQFQSARLERLVDLTDLVFRLQRVISRAEDRDAFRHRLCEQLVGFDSVEFAWFGTVDDSREQVDVAATAGRDRGYLDAVEPLDLETSDEPAVAAVRTRAPADVGDVTAALHDEPWRSDALAYGFQSVLSLPLVRDGGLYGVVSLYASETDAFRGTVGWALREVANLIAYSLTAFEWKRALAVDAELAVELTLPDQADLFSRVALDTGAKLQLDGLVPSEDSTLLFFLIRDGDPAAVASALEARDAVQSVRPISSDDPPLLEVRLGAPSLVTRIMDEGGTLRDLTATADSTRVLVTLPPGTDVRGFLGALEPVVSDIELQSRTQQTRPATGPRQQFHEFEQLMTERQFQALWTAYLGGYFEWPRNRTSEEVAAMLDISQPTFNRHLRVALRKLLSVIFEQGT